MSSEGETAGDEVLARSGDFTALAKIHQHPFRSLRVKHTVTYAGRTVNEFAILGRPEAIGMTNPFEDDDAEYLVLVNGERQYSLWPVFREIPAGWESIGPRGKRAECLRWIEENWTDMRPDSLVRHMEQAQALKK